MEVPIHVQNTRRLKYSDFWLEWYSDGCFIRVSALQYWSNSPMAKGGSEVKNMLYIPVGKKYSIYIGSHLKFYGIIKHTYGPTLKKNLARPITVDGKPQFYDVEAYVLIKAI